MINRNPHIVFLLAGAFLLSSCSLFRSGASGNQPSTDVQKSVEQSADFIDAKRAIFRGEIDLAVELLRKLFKENPNHHASAYELSRLLMESNSGEALTFAQKAAKLDGDNPWYIMHLGNLYSRGGKYKEAQSAFETLVKKHPENKKHYYYLINASLRNGDVKNALKTYDAILDKFGFDPVMVLKKKEIYLRIKKYDKAAEEVQSLIAQEPTNKRYYGILADVYMAAGKKDMAFDSYQKVLEIDPNDGKIHLVLSGWYASENQADKSFEEMKQAFQSPWLEVDEKVKVLLQLRKRLDEEADEGVQIQADTLLQILDRLHGEDVKVLAMKADYLAKEKKWPEAKVAYEKVIAKDSSKYLVWEQLVLISRELEDYKAMQNYAHRARNIFPQYPILYYFNGLAHYKLGAYVQAEASLKLGTSFIYKPMQELEFYTLLGMVRDSLKHYEEAENSFNRAMLADANNPEMLAAYARHLALLKSDLDRAEYMAQKALELNPNKVEFVFTYALVLYEKEEYDKALQWVQKGLIMDSQNASLLVLKDRIVLKKS